jgi:hypothetical protein
MAAVQQEDPRDVLERRLAVLERKVFDEKAAHSGLTMAAPTTPVVTKVKVH